MLVNRKTAPFDDAELRRAMALSLDRKSFIDILGQGEGKIGGAYCRRLKACGECPPSD